MNESKINRDNQWLSEFAGNVNSQAGEDGIIEKALEVIGNNNRWCVEFGAWDGMYMSNTYNLIANKNYYGVLIEMSSRKFRDLQNTFKGNEKVNLINAMVGFDEDNSLDLLLKPTNIPIDFDVLSIDIDGNDYHVWSAIKQYKPKLVVIEYNTTIPNEVEFIQPRDMRKTQGNGLLSISKLARQKGYELIAVTKCNAIFVDSKYFDLFGIKDNSLNAIRTDLSGVTYIFNGYDGTVFIRGCGRICWHSIPYKEAKMQRVPKVLRGYPGNYGIVKKGLAKIYRYLIGANRS